MEYGMDVQWKAGETTAFLLYNRWCREQALAMHEWDKASVIGKAIGERPTLVPASVLAARARAEA